MRQLSVLALLALLIGCSSSPAPTESSGSSSEAKSTNLEEDIKIMWSVEDPDPEEGWTKSTHAADAAAVRVFNTVNLIGLTRSEVAEKLRFDLRAKSYGYQFPFYPVKKGVLPVRIDNGNYGWQYNIEFDANQRVKRVERRGIE